MECIINRTLKDFLIQGKNLEAVKKHIKKHYRISIGVETLKRRLQTMNFEV
jgi:hypothetical protein